MNTSDEDLALAAAKGDATAFAALLDRLYDRLFSLCFRLMGTSADAEDLTQDICAALPSKLTQYRKDAKVTTWLYRVAVNAAHDRRRRHATYTKATEGWGDWETARRADIEQGQDQANWLIHAMNTLPADLRDTLALVLDDMTHAQVGEILGVSEGTISWRLSKARQTLRDLKQQEEAE